jgi:hypothetical protein
MKKSKDNITLCNMPKTSAYETFGLYDNYHSADIKKRYFELIRQYSPEHNPEKFMKIREAYEELLNPLHYLNNNTISLPVYKEKILSKIAEIKSKTIIINKENSSKSIFETPFDTQHELKTILKPLKIEMENGTR